MAKKKEQFKGSYNAGLIVGASCGAYCTWAVMFYLEGQKAKQRLRQESHNRQMVQLWDAIANLNGRFNEQEAQNGAATTESR